MAKTKAGAFSKHTIHARVREFSMPPIHDALVLGVHSPIGCAATRHALELLVSSPFAHIEVEDEVVSDILIREAILRRVPKERIIEFVITHIKPLMGAEEILHLDIEAEVALEG